jgi:hypothetical protein
MNTGLPRLPPPRRFLPLLPSSPPSPPTQVKMIHDMTDNHRMIVQ